MTLIGLAYNQKPEPTELPSELPEAMPQRGELSRPDEEPPSKSFGLTVAELTARDEFAEWDSPVTIAAVEAALSKLGKVVRIEATEEFPERLRAIRPDIVFNIAEGLHGVNRESHVPAICEFFGIPYSGSDPYTLSLCLDKGRTKETLAFHGVPTAPFAVARSVADLQQIARGQTRLPIPDSRSPLFIKPVHEGSSK